MALSFRDMFVDKIPLFFDRAEPAHFIPATGDSITCRAFIDYDVEMQPSTDAQVWERGTQIEVALSEGDDIGIGRQPVYGEQFKLWPGEPREATYTIRAVISNDGITAKVVVV